MLTCNDHLTLAADYRKAGLWNESRGYIAAADRYTELANLHRALAVVYSQPAPASELDIPVTIDDPEWVDNLVWP